MSRDSIETLVRDDWESIAIRRVYHVAAVQAKLQKTRLREDRYGWKRRRRLAEDCVASAASESARFVFIERPAVWRARLSTRLFATA
jgi:hypothetical protein